MNHRLNILIVEDEKNICDFLGAFLIGQGYQVSFAAKGKEALSLISSNCPDVVLLDLGLPDIDGMDVIESVRTWYDNALTAASIVFAVLTVGCAAMYVVSSRRKEN